MGLEVSDDSVNGDITFRSVNAPSGDFEVALYNSDLVVVEKVEGEPAPKEGRFSGPAIFVPVLGSKAHSLPDRANESSQFIPRHSSSIILSARLYSANRRTSNLRRRSKRMSFLSIATPFVELGIPVFPLTPKTKIPPSGFHFLEEATIDPVKVASWIDENPDYNVALLANGEFCFLEFDVAKGMSAAAAEMGHGIPLTRTQVSGKGFGHYIFKHTERSRALGNRSVNLPEGGEWFSFRAGNKYLVGAGSLHPNGNYYQTARDIEPIPMPDWLCDFVEKHSRPSKPKTCDDAVAVDDEFDFDGMMDFYGIGIVGEKDDVWQVVVDRRWSAEE